MNPHEYQTLVYALTTGLYIVDFIIRICLLVYIPKNRKPTAAMAWLLLIFIVPLFGTILFFIIGSTKLSRQRRSDQQHVDAMLRRYIRQLKRKGYVAQVLPPHDIQAKLGEALTSLAPTHHNAVQVLHDYDEIIKNITEKVRKATHHVYIEFYILALDTTTEPFFAALEDAVRRGVTVYVLFDAWGSRKFPQFKTMMRRLTAAGIHWHKILPLSLKPSQYNRIDLRNHRKIVVIDSGDAYIGSLNMIDKAYHRKDDLTYRELVLHLQGPSVNDAAAVIAGDWYLETGELLTDFVHTTTPALKGNKVVQLLPSGSQYPYPNNLRVFNSLIQSARKSIIITNPYLVPDESLLGALISAAQRGVRVSILNSEAMDQWMVGHAQRSYYAELLEAGVSISLYKKPQLVHEKYIVIDEEVGAVGSSNMDIRSFELNLECIVLVYDHRTARTLARHHDELLENSKRVQLATWKRRGAWQSFLDSIARLTSALQ